MREVTQAELQEIFAKLGLHTGDNLLVHAAIQYLGKPVGGLAMYGQAIGHTIGIPSLLHIDPGQSPADKGTLAVPAFNFGFARGDHYDPQSTPAVGMGSFAEYIRQLPNARRTPHPMQSLAVIGHYADDLANRDTPSAFDPGSSFERLLELDFKLLLLGATIQAVSIIHYSEQNATVPYRYWKDFSGQVKTPDGWQACSYRMFVRDLGANPHLDLGPIQTALEARGAVASNVSQLWYSCRMHAEKFRKSCR